MIAQASPSHDVQDYIEGVKSGEIVAGRLVKLAVDRHLKDLETAEERGLYFDENLANEACLFFPWVCKHSIGEWDGQPFFLSPWQSFIVWCLVGWRRKKDGTRRFRKAYLSVARKNGKTTMLAGLALYLMYADEPFEPGAEIYIAATDIDQACKMQEEARRMVEASPSLAKRSVIRKSPRSINYTQYNSFIKPVASDNSADGLNPHAVLMDEIHEWREPHRGALEKLTGGGASRRQQLLVMITTAGDDKSQIWIEEDEDAVKVVESVVSGNVVDDNKFVFIARIDDEDDPFDSKVWGKANPNLNVSVKGEYLEGEAIEAKRKPAATNKFLRYFCNRRVAASARVITAEMWAKGAKDLTVSVGAEGRGGVDLGRSNDWASIALCFPIRDKDGKVVRHEVMSRSWTCRHGGFRIDFEPFRTWISKGILKVCDGDQVDFRAIARDILELNSTYNIFSWAYDPAWASVIMQDLQEDGVNVFPMHQTHKKYNEACVTLLKDMDAGKIWHGNDPCLEWQAGNLIYNVNHEQLSKPDKSNRASKIDGMVSLLMALQECLFAEKSALDYYDKNQVEMG